MASPPLATLPDLNDRLPEPVAGSVEPRAEAALVDASALVRSAAGVTWLNEAGDAVEGVPDVVVAVVCTAAARVVRGGDDPYPTAMEVVTSYTAQYAVDPNSAEVYLTKAEKRLVRRAAGAPAVGSSVLAGGWTLYDPDTDTMAVG